MKDIGEESETPFRYWHPGIYEGLTESEALAQVGTNSDGPIAREVKFIREERWNAKQHWNELDSVRAVHERANVEQ